MPFKCHNGNVLSYPLYLTVGSTLIGRSSASERPNLDAEVTLSAEMKYTRASCDECRISPTGGLPRAPRGSSQDI